MRFIKYTLPLLIFFSIPVTAKVEEFVKPRVDGLRMDVCSSWMSGACGEPVANKWCTLKGYKRAILWEVDSNVGLQIPTKLLMSKEICSKETCDAFKVIVCYSS